MAGSVKRRGSVKISLAPAPPYLSLLHTCGLHGDRYIFRPAPPGVGGGTLHAPTTVGFLEGYLTFTPP